MALECNEYHIKSEIDERETYPSEETYEYVSNISPIVKQENCTGESDTENYVDVKPFAVCFIKKELNTENTSDENEDRKTSDCLNEYNEDQKIEGSIAENHSETCFPKEKPFRCETCGKSFLQSRNLRRHHVVHMGKKAFLCTTCGKSFSRNSDLRRHYLVHTGEKPFTCETCGKSFSDSNCLRRHCKVHTGEKPFTCETCSKSFPEQASLKKHRLTHSGEKPFSCETCGKSFLYSSGLRRHYVVHTGEKPFACETCGKSFSEKFILKRHVLMHTRKLSEKALHHT